MKKLFLIFCMVLTTIFAMAACEGSDNTTPTSQQPETPGQSDHETGKPENNGQDENAQEGNDQENDTDDSDNITTPDVSKRYLVLYCSRTSNTEQVAELIHSSLGCDIMEVEPTVPYDENYNAMLERAQDELSAIRQGDFPPIKTNVANFDDYDTIFIGYPIWYGSIATPIQTFLHTHASKLAGKRIALFATSGSSGISSSVAEAKRLCPDATFIEPSLLLTSSTLSQAEERVTEWLDKLGTTQTNPEVPSTSSLKMNIIVGDQTITATMEPNAAARDFLSRLPLEVTLNDFNNITEKIFYPNPPLNTEGVTQGCTPMRGDITIYTPWENVAIFCKNGSKSNQLIKIGRIDGDGIETLSVSGDIRVTFQHP